MRCSCFFCRVVMQISLRIGTTLAFWVSIGYVEIYFSRCLRISGDDKRKEKTNYGKDALDLWRSSGVLCQRHRISELSFSEWHLSRPSYLLFGFWSGHSIGSSRVLGTDSDDRGKGIVSIKLSLFILIFITRRQNKRLKSAFRSWFWFKMYLRRFSSSMLLG